jgi:hypothetical protein
MRAAAMAEGQCRTGYRERSYFVPGAGTATFCFGSDTLFCRVCNSDIGPQTRCTNVAGSLWGMNRKGDNREEQS